MTLITHQLVNGEDAKAVIILDGSGNQITSFGGGTQYTEGATDTTITGTAVLWEDASDTLRAVSAAKPLPVEIVAGAGSGGTAAADDADFTAGTTSGTPAMGVFESSPTSVTDGDLGIVGITTARRLKTSATIDAALPAGTNNIGDVDVLSSALPTGASTSAKQDTMIGHLDGVEGFLTTIDGDTGNISTKIDTLAGAVAGTEVQVDVLTIPTVTVNAHAVTNAGTFAVQVDGAALTSLQLQDDTVATLGTTTYTEATTKGTTIGAVRRDADTTLVDTTNEIGPLQMDANGRLKVEAFSGEALPVTLTSTTVTGTVAVTQSGTWDEVGINDSGNSITVDATNLDIRDIDAASDDITIHGDVGIVDQLDLTNTNPLAVAIVDGDGTQITSFGGGTQYTEDAAAAANPVGTALIGVRADSLAGITTTDGDNVAARMTDKGELYVKHVDAVPVTSATFATAAKQDTIIGHVDGIEGLLTTIDGDTGNISTKIDTIAGAVAGSEMQVDIVSSALPSGASTLAEQQSQTTHLATIAGDTTDIEAAVELLDDVVYTDDTSTHATGTSKGVGIMAAATPTDTSISANDIGMVAMTTDRKLHVAVMDALPAGTAAIGKLAANSGVDIGDVTLTANSGVDIGDVDVTSINSFAAHDAAIAGNPLIVGGVSSAAAPASVSADQEAVRAWYLRNGAAATVLTAAGALIGGDATNGLDVDVTRIVSGAIQSGALASGSVASGAIASGAIASGAIAAGAIAAGATSIATTEDTASAAADHLVKIAAVRLDTPVANANLSNDGDYTQPLVNNFGKLWVTGTVLEDTAHVAGEAIMQMGARRIDTAATSAGSSADWATVDASAEGALWSTLTPTTTSGCTIFRSLDLDESEEEIKASAGNVYGYFVFNAAATTHYLKFYNATAASVTVGTTTPVLTFPIPAGAAANVGFPYPVSFGTAISAAVTTGLADADTGAPAANACIVNVFYK